MEMSKILDCDAIDCTYNKEKKCHTLGVNIGSGEPLCDTFMHSEKKSGYDDIVGGIGSCKTENCTFNSSLECTASGIHMHKMGSHVDCTTFKMK